MPTEVARPEGGMSVDRHKNVLQPQEYTAEMFAEYFESEKARALRSSEIETIIGDDYDLARLREIVEADREGRCVVLQAGGYTDKDGENALKSSMNTCFYHNNPVTRYIADAVAEKLTRETAEAALKGERDG